jgi:hypothetical protein
MSYVFPIETRSRDWNAFPIETRSRDWNAFPIETRSLRNALKQIFIIPFFRHL